MDAKDLRIGNWVSKKYQSYPANTGSYWSESPILINDFEGIIQYPKVYKPIPLTPEWLEKFGANMPENEDSWDNYCHWKLGGIQLTIMIDNGEGYANDGLAMFTQGATPWYSTECRYVHQLQNLYYALTGNELNEKTNY